MGRRIAQAAGAIGVLVGFWLNLTGYRNALVANLAITVMIGVACWGFWPWLERGAVTVRRRWSVRWSVSTAEGLPAGPTTGDRFRPVLPWVDEGQLVMVLRHETDDTPERSITPTAWWCEVTAPGCEEPAVADDTEDDHRPVLQRVEVRFPRDFSEAPPLPLRPGRYKMEWWRHRFDSRTWRIVGKELLAAREFVLHPDGKVWLH